MTVEPWPRPIPRGPAVGDTVEIGDIRYRVTQLHPTDEGVLLRLVAVGGTTWVQAHELRWTGDAWRPETEAELRESWGK